ncbi:IPT/TIG domain-containing protein [Heterostelium album PN500]|uniref:IPT/TIG domain-containing protein n=1 Tax=Heterostelium pallidum (strain ATCC 26659 / Pp 5 / PN500) TaxID=670386 RepID=D3BJY2_HETP5|nr:IPT/TIG domain-containing protein [Heterostelium album PN500]EFA78212.1 IPT/TIG domain-containing protein [Heterostelium album PN500]|eukprot:XP_020430338.1 IPT/TIG domain-containing protein [Heterostelium album PN500]
MKELISNNNCLSLLDMIIINGDVSVSNIVYDNGFAYIYGNGFQVDSNNMYIGNKKIPATDYTVFNSTCIKLSFSYSSSDTSIIVQGAVFTWNPIFIDNVSNFKTEGGSITVSGNYLQDLNADNLNYIVLSNSPRFYNTISNSNISMTMNVFNVPNSFLNTIAGGNIPLIISIRNKNITDTWGFIEPTITNVNMSSNSITITGDSFGTVPSNVIVTVDDFTIQTVSVTNHTQIIADSSSLPSGYFNIAGQKNIGIKLKNYSDSYIINIRPIPKSVTSVSSDKGGIITVSGDLFNQLRSNGAQTTRSITVGPFSCDNTQPLFLNSNAFTCVMPPLKSSSDEGLNLPVSITIDDAESTVSISFSYDIPRVESIQQFGNLISVRGSRLYSPLSNDSKVVINATSYTPQSIRVDNTTMFNDITKVDSRIFILDLPIDQNLLGGSYLGYTTIHKGILRSNEVPFVIKPDIGTITFPPTKGGLISINGALFRNPINVTLDNKISKTPCTNATLFSTNLITCNLAPGSGKNISILVTVNNLTLNSMISYQPPLVISATSVTQSGGFVTIFGENFSPENLDVLINGTSCSTAPTCLSDTMILCPLSSDVITNQFNFDGYVPVSVFVNGQVDTKSVFKVESVSGTSRFNYLPIILPIGIITVLFIVGTTVVLTYIKIKKYRQLKAVMKFINSD